MRVMVGTPFFYPEVVGGSESVVKNLVFELKKFGVLSDIVTFRLNKRLKLEQKNKSLQVNGIKVIRLPAISMLPCKVCYRVITNRVRYLPIYFCHKIDEYDVLHFHNEIDLSLPVFAYFVKKPKILTPHTLSVSYDHFQKNLLDKFILKKVIDYYIAPSNHIKSLLLNLGVSYDRIELIYNGVNVNFFTFNKQLERDNLLLFVGRLDRAKNIETLLMSLKFVKKPVHLMMVGPPTSDRKYFKYVLSLAKHIERRTGHKITYEGVKEQSDLVKLYQKSAIVILPSVREGLPMVVLEALSCGTPVVASNINGIREIITSYKNGILVPPFEVSKLAEAIIYLLENEDERKRIGLEGRKIVEKKFSASLMAKKHIHFYKKLL
jgi:glycosyltransferase involved in cell wall biosynthesis